MISRLLLPSCVRLATYSLVRRSRRIRARQIMYSARLASRLPPRLRRWRTTFPEEASTGDTPQRLAKEASLLNLWVLSLRPRSAASRHGRYRCLPKRPVPGQLASPDARVVRPARRSLLRELGNGEPLNGVQTWLPPLHHEGHLRGGSVQPRRRVPLWSVRANGVGVPPVLSPANLGVN